MSDQDLQHAQEVKRRHERELMKKANVVSVGIGYRSRGGKTYNEVCIVVSVKAKVMASQLKRQDIIPAMIENVPIDVVQSGVMRAQ